MGIAGGFSRLAERLFGKKPEIVESEWSSPSYNACFDHTPVIVRDGRKLGKLIPSWSRRDIPPKLKKILEGKIDLGNDYVALPREEQDTSPGGTRTLKFRDIHTGRIVVLSGVGVVRSTKSHTGIDLTISPPEFQTPVSTELVLSHNQIDAEGGVHFHKNHTPLGTYDTPDLNRKIRNTERYSSLINIPDSLILEAHGTHASNGDCGWMVYSLPENARRLSEFLAFDLMYQKRNEHEFCPYAQYLKMLFQRIRKLHDADVVHLELHPGNTYPVWSDEKGLVDVVVTDWTTAQDLNNLPSAEELLSHGYVLEATTHSSSELTTGKQVAKNVDLSIAFISQAGLLAGLGPQGGPFHHRSHHKKEFSLNVHPLEVTKEVVEETIFFLAVSVLAYTSKFDFSVQQAKSLAGVLETVFVTYVTKYAKKNPVVERLIPADGDFYQAEHVGWIPDVLTLLTTRVAELLTEMSDPSIEKLSVSALLDINHLLRSSD